jgi:hypothetical protein
MRNYVAGGLARAHAKAGDASTISGYLGSSDGYDALGKFGMAYADQSEMDFETLQKVAESGRIPFAMDPALKKRAVRMIENCRVRPN